MAKSDDLDPLQLTFMAMASMVVLYLNCKSNRLSN